MSRSKVSRSKQYRVVGIAALALLAALLLAVPASAAACGEEGSEDTGPLITDAKLTPANLPAEGGTGTISARVEDDCGVQQVYAEINSTEGVFIAFQLLPFEDINSNARVYRGEFQVPANFQEWEVGYQATISAEDTNGAFAEAYAGEINVAGTPPFDEPPYIWQPSVAPSRFGGFGGPARIAVEASDTRALANVYAIVTYPNKTQKEISLEGTGSSLFEGAFTAPSNWTSSPREYSVSVFAEDDIGQTTGGYAGTITVEPKGTPNPGHIGLSARYLRIGPVTLGQSKLASITLTNRGAPGSPPASGILETTGPPFFLPGAGAGGIAFNLDPGEQQSFDLSFAPTVWGPHQGRLTMVRDDGRQPDAGIPLYGWGVKHPTDSGN